MKDRTTEVKIDQFKPVMKSLKSVDDIPLPAVLSAKADGEFSVLYHSPKECYTVNRWGRLREDFPALNEICQRLRSMELNDVVLLCELYAVEEDGQPAKLPTFIHVAKGQGTDHTRLRIGVWDVLKKDLGDLTGEDYGWRLSEVSGWLSSCQYCHVLPFSTAETQEEARAFWKTYVEEQGYEGVIAHTKTDIYKIKPFADVDAVIIGLNKRELFKEKKITSFKVALMNEAGDLVELSDVASGIDHSLRSFLWRLMEYKVGEDKDTIYIKPLVICTLEYTETFISARRKWQFQDGQYIKAGEVEYFSLRHPRLIGFRSDKKLDPRDIGLHQI